MYVVSKVKIIYLCNQCTSVRQEQSSHNAHGINIHTEIRIKTQFSNNFNTFAPLNWPITPTTKHVPCLLFYFTVSKSILVSCDHHRTPIGNPRSRAINPSPKIVTRCLDHGEFRTLRHFQQDTRRGAPKMFTKHFKTPQCPSTTGDSTPRPPPRQLSINV